MIRLAAAALAAAALASAAGSARADVFAVVQQPERALAGAGPPPLVLASPDAPNLPGSLALPPEWTERAGVVQTRSQPELEALWRQAGQAYGIPWNVLGAINKIETNFGRNMGPSSAGAVGWMQFMPDTWLRWGTDADADGVADPWDPEDAVFSAARYLAAAGAREDLYRGVYAYNHADWYVRQVLDLAELYEAGGAQVTFELDTMQAGLEEARAALAERNERLQAAAAAVAPLAERERALLARLEAADSLSDRLELQKEAVLAGVAVAEAQAVVAGLEAEVAAAEQALEQASLESRAASFAPGARTLMGAAWPADAGGWVFPVGGGPATVSVGRDHHDYPAADIAAPQGAPVYALADAHVQRAWHADSGRCGIGLTLQTRDGQVWTYCHLAHLDPQLADGAMVAAGQLVGLVGSTGRSTGPHLHLQLQPAASLPQDQPWFQAFAGSAFRWQGEGAPAVVAVAPGRNVFAVVGPADASTP